MQPGKPDHLWRATVERNLALTSIALHNEALHYYLVVALDEFLSRHFVGCEWDGGNAARKQGANALHARAARALACR